MAATRATNAHYWTDEETEFMLHQVRELNISKFRDGRKTRNASLYEKIASKMEKAGFVRTPEQIKIKWKNAKAAYANARKNNGRSGSDRATCPHYEIMEELLGSRPLSQAGECGVDVGGAEEAKREPTEMRDNEEQRQQQLDDESSDNSRTSMVLENMSGRSAQQPRRRQGNNESIAQLCLEMRESRSLLLQELRESGECLRQLMDIMRESRVDHNRHMAALLEGLNNLRRPAPSPHTPEDTDEFSLLGHL